MPTLYRASDGYQLQFRVDATGRTYGYVDEMYVLEGRVNPDRDSILTEAFTATLDGSDPSSVAGSTIVRGEVHPYFNGDTEDRPIARVVSQAVARVMNTTEALLRVRWETQRLPAWWGANETPSTGAIITRRDITEVTPLYFLRSVSAGGGVVARYDVSNLERSRTIQYYTLSRVATTLTLPDISQNDQNLNKVVDVTFLGASLSVMYGGTDIRQIGGGDPRYLVSDYYKSLSALPALAPNEFGDGMNPVPAIPKNATLVSGRDADGDPFYTVAPATVLYGEVS